MATYDVDVVVVGLGPGREHAAIKLGRAGLDVVGVERRLVGGECPYYGCVPSKMMIRAADALAEARRVADLAGKAEVAARLGCQVARRVGEEATDDWHDDAARRAARGGRRPDRPGQRRLDGTGRVRVGDDDVRRRARRGAQHRHVAGARRRSTGSRTRRTGPTARS